jgi:hypothetical protein
MSEREGGKDGIEEGGLDKASRVRKANETSRPAIKARFQRPEPHIVDWPAHKAGLRLQIWRPIFGGDETGQNLGALGDLVEI